MVMIMVITPAAYESMGHGTGEIALVIAMAHQLGMFGLSWATGWLIDRWNDDAHHPVAQGFWL